MTCDPGNAAVFDLGNWSFMGGLAAMYAWRSVYWSEGVSARTRALLMMDWIIRYVCFYLEASGYKLNIRTAGYGDVTCQLDLELDRLLNCFQCCSS